MSAQSVTGPEFSLCDAPFSSSGSWLALSSVTDPRTCVDHVHLVSHQNGMHPVLRLTPVRGGSPVAATVTATPTLLTWAGPGRSQKGRIKVVYDGPEILRVRGAGLGLWLEAVQPALTSAGGVYLYRDPVDGSHVFTTHETGRRYRVTRLSGAEIRSRGVQSLGAADRALHVPEDEGPWEIAIEEYDSARRSYRPARSFDSCRAAITRDFNAFLDGVAPWRTSRTPAAAMAAYILWSAAVRPAGFATRFSVVASKHGEAEISSWDHCFNALALAPGRPELARDLFHLPFDHQDAHGALPDSVTHSEIRYNYVKPPIHGWTLRRLRRLLPSQPDHRELAQIYTRLARWTSFWLTTRRAPRRALPHYHHGRDSGWDEASTFDGERLVETADLAAFLSMQARILSGLAGELGRDKARTRWNDIADRLRGQMLRQLWKGGHFVARGVDSGRTWTGASLLNLAPVVLGAELPGEVLARLAAGVEDHLTEFGLATELPTSPAYRPEGRWRGPIWAPSTVLVEDGLRLGGYTSLADDVSRRFRRLCEAAGFAEGFDAMTGAALHGRGHTLTASAYLILAGAEERRRQGKTA